jgi:hypothetical protein
MVMKAIENFDILVQMTSPPVDDKVFYRGIEDYHNSFQVTRLSLRDQIFRTQFHRDVVREAQNLEVLYVFYCDYNLGEFITLPPHVKKAVRQMSTFVF